MPLEPRNEDENTKEIKKKLSQIETQLKQIGEDLKQEPNNSNNNNALKNVLKQQDLLMRNLEKLENNESERNNRNEKLKSELEDSISTFNQATEDTRVKYISVANSYLKKLNTDNQQQDFKQALDAKFKAIDKQTDQLIQALKERNEQAENEIQTYKQTLESKMRQNDQLVQKYNKTLNKMTHGLFALFYVVLVVALVAMVTGPIGHILSIDTFLQTIHHQIVEGKSIWRYLAYFLYLIPFILLTGILLLCAKLINALDRNF
ncbi:Uncharacterized 27.7 kDa protein [Mycobacteroides abscessus]|nr:Uncharacterized 27.7 kDa protein [Mycobacteroides abscessus]